MSALYQESPSLLFSSMVENAGLMRGVPAAMNGWPSAVVPVGCARLTSPLRQQVRAARSRIADRDRRLPPQLALHVDVADVHARCLDVELHRPHRDRARAIERRARERRVDDDRTRRERRVRHGDDQVLVVVGVEVEPVAAAHGGAAVAEDVPREAAARRQVRVRRVLVERSDRRLRRHQVGQRRVAVVLLARHRRELVAQAGVQRQPRRDLEVVLDVEAEQREAPVAIELRLRRQADEASRAGSQERVQVGEGEDAER